MMEGKLPQEDSSTHIQTAEAKLSIAISRTDATIGQLLKAAMNLAKRSKVIWSDPSADTEPSSFGIKAR